MHEMRSFFKTLLQLSAPLISVLSQDRLGLSPNIAEQIAPFMGELIQFSIILAFINHERQIQIA